MSIHRAAIVTSGLAIYDTMQYVKPDIATYCIGQAASMGALLLAAGTRANDFLCPMRGSCCISLWEGSRDRHRYRNPCQGNIEDEGNPNKISSHTGQPIEKMRSDTDRDFFMSGEEAKDYGIVDEVISSIKEKEKDRKSWQKKMKSP